MDDKTTLIRRIRADEGMTLRHLRLSMLTESPNAFGVPLAMIQAMTDEQWAGSAAHLATSPNEAYYFAERDGVVCGTAECELCPPLVLTHEQVLILARALNGTAPGSSDLVTLGVKYGGVAQQLMAVGPVNSLGLIMALSRVGLGFFDIVRVGSLAYGSADPADTTEAADRDGLFGPQTALLCSMWVSPEARGCGIGAQLLSNAIAYARDNEQRSVILFVTETQPAARSLYERNAFTYNGHRMRLPSNPALWLLGMSRNV